MAVLGCGTNGHRQRHPNALKRTIMDRSESLGCPRTPGLGATLRHFGGSPPAEV